MIYEFPHQSFVASKTQYNPAVQVIALCFSQSKGKIPAPPPNWQYCYKVIAGREATSAAMNTNLFRLVSVELCLC